ncbi:MAG: chloride channel protein, partial [Cyclobacteriaceae bacterium]|nr:chloride channel protein [Cyclobacteriaceae bacterium]
AGMGAGIGSIFHAPLAGALFSAEVLYSDPEVESEVILPSTVASIIAYSIYSSVFGWKHMFIETSGMGFSNPLELIPYLVLALTLAVVANFFVKIFYRTRNAFKSLSITPFLKPAIGGFLTGTFGLALILIFDDKKFVVDVMGGGYGILQEIFYNGTANVSISVLLLIGFGKILTTSFSIGSGGSAGVFGPSMVIGGTIGTAVGFLLQPVFPDIIANPVTFTVVGMAGFFAAAANTPISTIIMVSELTGNYELLLPSMWVCSIAYLVSRKWSIFENQVPNKTFSKAHFSKYAPDIINVTTVGESYRRSRKFNLIKQDSSLADIREVVDKSRQRIFPVVDENEIMQGVFNIDDVTHILHYPDPLIRTASDLMNPNCTVVYPDQTLLEVSKLMSFNAVDELMVVDSPENKKVKGIITSSDIVLAYSRKLSEIKYGADIEEQYSEEVLLLKSLALKNVIEKDLLTISHDATLGELVSVIIKSKRNIFPVVDTSRHLTGIVLLNDIRKLMFDTSKYDNVHIKEIMIKPPEIVIITDNFETIINKFEKSGAWNLPVVDKKKVYQGLVSKSRIFSAYRNALIEQSKN